MAKRERERGENLRCGVRQPNHDVDGILIDLRWAMLWLVHDGTLVLRAEQLSQCLAHMAHGAV